MKKILFPVLLFSALIVSCSEEATSTANLTPATKSLKFASANLRGWSKAGNCLRGYGDCAIAIVSSPYLGEENGMPVTLSVSKEAQLVIDNTIKKVNEDGDKLTFANDFKLPEKISNELGYSSVTIKSGEYYTKFDSNEYGQTTITVVLE